MKDYDSLLERAWKEIPESKEAVERFENPKADVLIEGNKTIVRNFDLVCSTLRRKPVEVAKFLFKEMAMPGSVQGARLILIGKSTVKLLNEKIAYYSDTHVVCRECKKPDTHLEDHDRSVAMLVCEACGAKNPVRK